MPVSPIPAVYPRVTAYLVAEDADRALAWYAEVFGAEETMRLPGPGGRVMHAEFRIGDTLLMIGEAMPEMGIAGPHRLGGTPVSFVHYVEDADAAVARAVAAGAVAERPVADQPYGDRMGTILDPFGHRWHVATHVEDVPPEEIMRRMAPAG